MPPEAGDFRVTRRVETPTRGICWLDVIGRNGHIEEVILVPNSAEASGTCCRNSGFRFAAFGHNLSP
jgi:hypothetical protein